MDQEFYYYYNSDIPDFSEINTNQEFNKLLSEQQIEFNTILKKDKKKSKPITNEKIMKEHIDNLHTLIFNYIQFNGINSDLVLSLKKEINKYQLLNNHE